MKQSENQNHLGAWDTFIPRLTANHPRVLYGMEKDSIWGKPEKESKNLSLEWIYPRRCSETGDWKELQDNCQQSSWAPSKVVAESHSNPYPRIYVPADSGFIFASLVDSQNELVAEDALSN